MYESQDPEDAEANENSSAQLNAYSQVAFNAQRFEDSIDNVEEDVRVGAITETNAKASETIQTQTFTFTRVHRKSPTLEREEHDVDVDARADTGADADPDEEDEESLEDVQPDVVKIVSSDAKAAARAAAILKLVC